MQTKQVFIADTLHGTILMSNFEKEIISTTLFNRLHNISQNSTAYLTFPANRTKRFEHSLGTMKLCGDIFYYSVCNTQKEILEKFFSEFKNNVFSCIDKRILSPPYSDKFRPILGDENLKKDKLENLSNILIKSVFYNNYLPGNTTLNDENKLLYLILFQAIRICSLLHDLGHPPFSHITESALHEVHMQILEEKNGGNNLTKRKESFLENIGEYRLEKKGFQLHETMGNQMVTKIISDLLYNNNSWYSDLSFEYKYFKVLIYEIVESIFKESTPLFSDIHRIIDGSIDGDRLDYTSRDSLNSGINHGKIEYDRLISSMKILIKDTKNDIDQEQERYIFIPNVKTLSTIEDFFARRWNLYKNIIYHHRVVKTDTFLQKCLKKVMFDYLNKGEEEQAELKVLPDNISGLWKAIKISTSNKDYFDALNQWDDAWLLTILKKHYFGEYSNGNNNIKFQLEEFLSNKKNYFSVIKTKPDFDILDEALKEKIMTEKLLINNEEITFNKLSLYDKINNNIYDNSIAHKLHALFKLIDEDFEYIDFLKNHVTDFVSEYHSTTIQDTLVVRKKMKTGLEGSFLFQNDDIFPISEVSTIKKRLEEDIVSFPIFFIYLRFKKEDIPSDMNIFYTDFLKQLGSYLGDKTIQYINEHLKKELERL